MNNLNESGRSMVEMLGVLAIIGVLSIGGIAGYTQAMKKYRVNEAINQISLTSVECQGGYGDASVNASIVATSVINCSCSGTNGVVVCTSTDSVKFADISDAIPSTVGTFDAGTGVFTPHS